jgi:hypothetical protein
VSEIMGDDVDGGCTSFESPVLDLGGRAGLELSWWRRVHLWAGQGGDVRARISRTTGARDG